MLGKVLNKEVITTYNNGIFIKYNVVIQVRNHIININVTEDKHGKIINYQEDSAYNTWPELSTEVKYAITDAIYNQHI